MKPSCNFSELIAPYTRKVFFTEYFEEKPFCINRNNFKFYDGFPDINDVSILIAKAKFSKGSNFLLTNRNGLISEEKYVPFESVSTRVQCKAGIDIEFALQEFTKGNANILLKDLTGEFPILDQVCSCLANDLSCNCEAHLFLMPSGGTTAPKYETTDLFILPILGRTTCKIHKGPLDLPLPSQANQNFELNDLLLLNEFSVWAGDTIYIPRGSVYELKSLREVSLLAIIKLSYVTNLRIVLDVLRDIGLSSETLRRGIIIDHLNRGVDLSDYTENFSNLLRQNITPEIIQNKLERRLNIKKNHSAVNVKSVEKILTPFQ
jgi:hypothetical protein